MYCSPLASAMFHSPPTATYTGEVCANTPTDQKSWLAILPYLGPATRAHSHPCEVSSSLARSSSWLVPAASVESATT